MNLTNDNLEKILSKIDTYIGRLDTKATAIFSAVGIIFGLSSILVEPSKSIQHKTIFIIVGIFYLLIFLCLVSFFVLIIFPRRKINEHIGKTSKTNLYVEDIYSMTKSKSFESFVSNNPTQLEYIDQIKNNSIISHRKQLFLCLLSLFTIPFTLLLILMIIIVVLG